jgi:hypothetical protein
MSKGHQASRRRTYGRRQHEIHERTERFAEATSVGAMNWLDESELHESGHTWAAEPVGREASGGWLQARGID